MFQPLYQHVNEPLRLKLAWRLGSCRSALLRDFPDAQPDRLFACHGTTSHVLCCGRGIGGSTIFPSFWEYSTDSFAADALALLEHLGWERTHLIGMSLGGELAEGLVSELDIAGVAPVHLLWGCF